MMSEVSSGQRKIQLLQLSRRSRSKWIMDAAREDDGVRQEVLAARADANTVLSQIVSEVSPADGLSVPADEDVDSTMGPQRERRAAVKRDIPGQQCLQSVLDLLSEISNDAEFVDAEALAQSLPDVEDDAEFDSTDDESSSADDDSSSSDSDSDDISAGNGEDEQGDNVFAEAKRSTRRQARGEGKHRAGKTERRKDKEKAKGAGSDLTGLYSPTATAYTTRADDSISQQEVLQVPFLTFLRRLRAPDSAVVAIVKSVQLFSSRLKQESISARVNPQGGAGGVADFVRTADDRHTRWAGEIWAFIAETSHTMRKVPQWAAESADVWAQTLTFFEKFLFIKLYPVLHGNQQRANTTGASGASASVGACENGLSSQPYAYGYGYAVDGEILRQDDGLLDRMNDLNFITPTHLDISALGDDKHGSGSGSGSGGSQSWQQYFEEPVLHLHKLSLHRSPVDIIGVLRNCTISIAEALKRARPDVHAPGADELLPMMVLALQQAKPRCLHSCIQYIQRYTPRARLDSEAGYLLTHLMSAVKFLELADESMLTISPREFEYSLQECHRAAQVRVKKLTLTGGCDEGSASTSRCRGLAAALTSSSTGRARSATVEQNNQRKERNAAASTQMQQLVAPKELFASADDEQRLIEALAGAGGERELCAVWAKYRKSKK